MKQYIVSREKAKELLLKASRSLTIKDVYTALGIPRTTADELLREAKEELA